MSPSQPDEPNRSSGCFRGGSGGRILWPVPALALAIAVLLAFCGWLFLGSSPPRIGESDVAATAAPSNAWRSLRDVPLPEATSATTSFSERTVAAPIGALDRLPAAVSVGLRPETLVYGSLLDPSHAAIGAARFAEVRFIDQSGRRRSSDAREEGTYALHALGFGKYWVTASAEGYRSLDETIDLRPDQPSMRIDFTLQKAVLLRVSVTTPDGRSLLEVLKETQSPMGARLLVPVATREPPGRRFEGLTGSLNDKFGVGRFEERRPRVEPSSPGSIGILRLDCDLPVQVSLLHYQVVLQTKRVATSRDEVNFVVSPDDLLANLATIRVRVIDAATSLPIPRARVTLGGGTYFDSGTATDPQGIATIDRREPGRFDVEVCAKGYELHREAIDALPGEITDLGTVALEEEVMVEGRVVDLEGHPLAASFSLGVLDPVDHRIHRFRQEWFESSGDGSFEIEGLGRGEYVMRTRNHDALDDGGWRGVPWVSGNVLLDTRAGSISGIEIRLHRASTLVLRVAGGAGEGASFRVDDELGRELVAGLLHGSEPRPLALPAGSYDVSLLDPRGLVLSKRSVTLGSESVDIDLAD